MTRVYAVVVLPLSLATYLCNNFHPHTLTISPPRSESVSQLSFNNFGSLLPRSCAFSF
jgi:hypothetical protein